MEGAEDSSCQMTTYKPKGFREDLRRGVGQDPPPGICKNLLTDYRVSSPSTELCFAMGWNTYFFNKIDISPGEYSPYKWDSTRRVSITSLSYESTT